MTRRAGARLVLLASIAAVCIVVAACGGPKEGQAPTPATSSPAVPATPPAGAKAAGTAPAAALVPDVVLATVNGQPIRARKFMGVVENNRARLRELGRPVTPEAEKAMREAALEALVSEELLIQASESLGVRATDAEIESELSSVKSGFPSEAEFKSFLAQAELTDADLREEARRRSTVRGVIKSIGGSVSVPEGEARKFYDANTEMFREGEKVRALIVVIKSKPDDPEPLKADARKRIEEGHKRALAGEDFAALARQYSQVPNAAKGGDLGFFGKGEGLFPNIEEAAFSTPAGQVSGIFETPTGLNFIKVVEKKASRIRPFEEVKASLVADLGEMQQSRAVEARLVALKSQATIEVLRRDLVDGADTAAAPAPKPAAPGQPDPAAR